MADFVFFCHFFQSEAHKGAGDMGLTDRAQLLYSLRKHGLCHFLWQTHSGSYLHTVSLVYIHLTKHAKIMYSFGPWGLLIHKKK